MFINVQGRCSIMKL